MKRVIPVIILLAVLTSCSTTYRVGYSKEYLDSYVGLTHQQIVQQLGAPMADVSDGGVGYILVYEGSRDLFLYSSRYAKASKLPQAQFYMDSGGVCYKVLATNTDPVRVTSVGGTIALVLLILLLFPIL